MAKARGLSELDGDFDTGKACIHRVISPKLGPLVKNRSIRAPEWIRTTDTGFRRAALYPTELLGPRCGLLTYDAEAGSPLINLSPM